jgi:hypothetical protein
MKKTLLALALVAGLTSFAGSAKAAILIDTLHNNANTQGYYIGVDSNYTIGQLFRTTSDSYNITGLQLGLFNNWNTSGSFTLAIYTAINDPSNIGYSKPGSLIESSTYDASNVLAYTGNNSDNPFVVSGLNINLQPDQNYFLIAQGVDLVQSMDGWDSPGSLAWLYNSGATSDWEVNHEGGWSVATVITAVPEPSTYALLGLGALALVVAYRRKVA